MNAPANVGSMRFWIFSLGTILSLGTTVEATGLVGWPGSFKTSTFCKTYGCTGATTRTDEGWGGTTVTYRVSKLSNAVLHVNFTSDNEISTALLNFNGRVYTQITAAESQAVNVFLQSATGRKVAFPLSECRRSEDPNRSRPPVLVADGEGHFYNATCASVRSTDISREQAAALGITPKTLTGFAVEPRY